MAEKFRHTVLIVDDEESVGRSIARLIKRIGAKAVYLNSGRAALKRLEADPHLFSLILSDQRMPEMEGSDFLEQAKEIAPEAVRFLITAYADIHVVADAVNRGAIHRFITKPWNNDVLTQMIASGFEHYDVISQSHHLFVLAKKQNKELYRLNMELIKRAENHKKNIKFMDKQIEELRAKLEQGITDGSHFNEIETLLKKNEIMSKEKIESFYSELMIELHAQFQELAARNGFSLSENFFKEFSAHPDSDTADI